MEILSNTTNISSSSPHTYQIILGCLSFFLILPFVLIPINRYPLGSTGAVLVGAFLMVITTVIDQSRVYTVIGDVNNLKTIFLLWGMMLISSYFEREHLIDYLLTKLFPIGLTFHWWIVRLSIIDSILAALFTNDVACVILTPLILNRWIDQKRDKHELNTLLLTLATQANIGSTLTIFGNPQMALIASKSNAFINPHSRLELKTCVKYLWLPTTIVWLLNLFCLLIHYHLSKCNRNPKTLKNVSNEMSMLEQSHVDEHKSITINTTTPILHEYTDHSEVKHIRESNELTLSVPLKVLPSMIDRSASVASFSNLNQSINEITVSFRPSQSRLFKSILFLLLIIVISLLFASNEKIRFDIGLIPVGAAIILLVVDTFINHQAPILILTRIDWNVLLLFFGLFVWLDGLNSTGIPHRIWIALNLESARLTDIKSLLLFFVFTLIGSNIFSNVPLTLLVLEQISRTGDHLNLILNLAFLTTIAGNLTLFGSVANLIVAQKALISSIEYRFDFWTYFKFGFPTTIIFSLIGMFIIYGLLNAIH